MSAEDFLCKEWDCEQEDLQRNLILNADVRKFLKAMKEFAKQEAEKAFDAGDNWCNRCMNAIFNQDRYPEDNKETYINNLFNNDK